jgi:hypothetical protein
MLDAEYKYYIDHQQELLQLYKGRFIVIKDKTVVGDYDSQAAAYLNSIKKFELGTFIIQECTEGNSGYTQTYHSRVIFA